MLWYLNQPLLKHQVITQSIFSSSTANTKTLDADQMGTGWTEASLSRKTCLNGDQFYKHYIIKYFYVMTASETLVQEFRISIRKQEYLYCFSKPNLPTKYENQTKCLLPYFNLQFIFDKYFLVLSFQNCQLKTERVELLFYPMWRPRTNRNKLSS